MAAKSEKQYNSFVKGLITEASPLTYPENSSLDEDNFVLKRNGARERRLGIEYETNYALVATSLASTIISSGRQSFHTWTNPGGDTSVSIGVVRIYNKLWFVDMLTDTPSNNLLNSGAAITVSGLLNGELETAIVNNFLVLVSKDLSDPVVLSYNKITDTVIQTVVPLQVRDFWGIVDGLALDERPTTLSEKHLYNLINQGWSPHVKTVCNDTDESVLSWMNRFRTQTETTDTNISETEIVVNTYEIPRAITCMFDQKEKYPSNSDIWYVGKYPDASSTNKYQKFSPSTLTRNSVYSMEAPKGSFIISPYDRGTARRNLVGIPTLPLDKENGRVSTIASYAGRVFYSGIESFIEEGDGNSPNLANYIFFSQIVLTGDKIGKCYQEADPTSDQISDIVDTDGGAIQIPEAGKIYKLVAAKASLLVLAENGVWEIFGDTQGFVATSYQVNKVSSNGCSAPGSVVEASGNVFAWSKAGIYAYTEEPTSGRYKAESISLMTIQSLYEDISAVAKNNCKSYYDEKENRVRWLYSTNPDYSSSTYVNKYNKELILDLTLQAFYPHSIGDGNPYVTDYVDVPNYVTASVEEAIYVGADSVFVGTDAVVVNSVTSTGRASQFAFLTMIGTSFTFSKYHDTTFKDWTINSTTGIDYSSYLVTGYELNGEMLRYKQIPYILFFFERTEDGFTTVGENLVADNQSSCLVQAQWNWANSVNSGRWGNQFQAYRLLRNYIPSGASDTFDYGYEVIVTKNKLRGSGRCLSLKIQSETGRDMRLLGWGTLVTGKTKP